MTKNSIYKIQDDLGNEFEYSTNDLEDIRILEDSDNKLIVQRGNSIHHLEIIDRKDKIFTVLYNDEVHQLTIMNSLDIKIDKMGMKDIHHDNEGELYAPMPGLVLKIHVKPGDQVEKEDSLITLEAMKMENLLVAATSGTIEKIEVSVGDSVDKQQLLLTIG